MKQVFIVVFTLLANASAAFPQALTRSGTPQGGTTMLSPTAIPCAGSTLYQENFEAGLGLWTIIDGDSLTPNSQIGLIAGWQARADYYDSTNTMAVSPSWYSPIGKSNDWLISPAITLGVNPCLSWDAYSKDQYFKEAYEVRISTGGPDTASFLSGNPVFSTISESEVRNTRAVSLLPYAGQTVHIAFRQTSDDKFVLAIDNVKVTNVNQNDIGVYSFEAPASDPGDTITFEVSVANYGSDTVRSFEVRYSIESGPVRLMTLDSIALAPNGTYTFDHITAFTSDPVEAFYDFCAWTSLPNQVADQESSNDSLCSRFASGTPVGRAEPRRDQMEMRVFPNPADDHVSIQMNGLTGSKNVQFTLLDLQGRALCGTSATVHAHSDVRIDLSGLPEGIYILNARSADGRNCQTKLIVR